MLGTSAYISAIYFRSGWDRMGQGRVEQMGVSGRMGSTEVWTGFGVSSE